MIESQDKQKQTSRREFVKKTSLATLAWPLASFMPADMDKSQFGFAQASYAIRWNSKTESNKYPRFTESLDMIDHCHQVEMGGTQLSVRGWTSDYAMKVRRRLDQYQQYFEGSIRLPADQQDIPRFEGEVKACKEAGAEIIRTVCLSGRRYENFDSLASFNEFRTKSVRSLELAEPIIRRNKIKLAVENHKDWRASEIIEILNSLGSEWVGVTLDTGNNISLMEDPMKVVEQLAPLAFSCHLKDMGVQEYEHGFLLSEVPLGDGILDLQKVISVIRASNPNIKFNLEMITRDPLEIPCLSDSYWSTFDQVPGKELASLLRTVKNEPPSQPLPQVAGKNTDEKLLYEETNNQLSIDFAQEQLGL